MPTAFGLTHGRFWQDFARLHMQAGLQIAVLGAREYLDPIACVQRQTDAPDAGIRRRLAQMLLGQPQGLQTLLRRKRLLAAALQWQSLHP